MAAISSDSAFLMIDIQNDFCPGGALAVPDGEAVVPVVNKLRERFLIKVLTQDWHPADHSSFASRHVDGVPFGLTTMSYGDQVLWPDHCIQGSSGAAFHDDLETDGADLIIRKGFRSEIDSYSAFFENDKKTRTGLDGYLRERGVSHVFLAGLATDFCVYYTAIDAVGLGYGVSLVTDACRAIDLEGSLSVAMADMAEKGVTLTNSSAL